MESLTIAREELEPAIRPLFNLSDSELDEISQSVYLKEIDDNNHLEMRATDGLAHLISKFPISEVTNESQFLELSVDLDTLEQITKKVNDDLKLKRSDRSLQLEVFDGHLYLRQHNFDSDIYDPFFENDGSDPILLDVDDLKQAMDAAKKLSSSSLSPEYSYVFMEEDCAWICNGYSVTRVNGDYCDYSFPIQCSDFVRSLIKWTQDDQLILDFGEETVELSNERTSLYHEKSDTELSQDYKDVVSDDFNCLFQVNTARLKTVLQILNSVPFGDGSLALYFTEGRLECELMSSKTESSSFLLSTEPRSPVPEDHRVETTISHLKSVVDVQSASEITVGLDQYCLAVNSDSVKSVIFVQ